MQAMQTILSVDAAPFRLVFAGGTCLARAHRLVERMSEDVDFKVVPPAATMSNNQRRQALGDLRDRLESGLTAAGFILAEPPQSRDANQYTVLHLRTGTADGEGKRYAEGNNVGAGALRDFYGALSLKKAQKGIFVTTSAFSPSAIETARGLGSRIVLIDGIQLSRLMIRYNVGCRDEDVLRLKKIDEDFFEA